MSFKREMARRKLLATRVPGTEVVESIVFTAVPLVKVEAKSLSSKKPVTLLQKIKEGKDLEDLSSVMDIRLLKCVSKNENFPQAGEKIQLISVSTTPEANTAVEILPAPPQTSDTIFLESTKKKVRLKSMQDLLEVLPEKSCEEFLYDCIPQLLTNVGLKDSANYFQRYNEIKQKDMFSFADVHAQYPAEKRNSESSLKFSAEPGIIHHDTLASITLKTTKSMTSLIFETILDVPAGSFDIKHLEQASAALEPSLTRLLSRHSTTSKNAAIFEAIQQHLWWCSASRSAATTSFPVSVVNDKVEPVVFDNIHEMSASEESQISESTSFFPTSSLPVDMRVDNHNQLTRAHNPTQKSQVHQPLSAEELVQEGLVAELYEKACSVLCTPIIHQLHKHSFVHDVNVSHNSLRNNGVSALAVIIMNSSRIERLDVCNNGISHIGVKHLCCSLLESNTIRELRLDCNPLGVKGATQLSGALCCSRLNSSIESLSLSACKLEDSGCAAILKCLLGAVSMKSLNLSLNSAGIETAKAAADVLPLITALETLSLRWNDFIGSSAVVFCQGTMNNRSITDLDLSWNAFGEVEAVSHLAEALKVLNHLKTLDVSYNRVDGRGAYILGSALESNHHISSCNFSGNPVGMLGARLLSQLVLTTSVDQSSKRGRKIQLDNCSIHYIDVSLFDPHKANGKYELDLSDSYSRIVMGSILRMHQLNQGFIIESTMKINGALFAKVTWNEETIPKCGFVQFQFESLHHFPSKIEDCLSSKHVSSIKELLCACHDEGKRLSTFKMLTGCNDYFSLDQVKSILDVFHEAANRVALMSLLSFQIAPSHHRLMMQQFLTCEELELQSFGEKSQTLQDFTIMNPTGHYRLNLDVDDDRQLMDLLIKIRSHVKRRRLDSFAAQKYPTHLHGLEWCILNAKWNGKETRVHPGWMPPSQGILEFDFTAALQSSKLLIEHGDFCNRMNHCESDRERVILLRQLSNTFSFHTTTALKCIQKISNQKLLEDCVVALFDSIHETLGFQYILSQVGPSCRDNVIRSIGIHNFFCTESVVAYHVLDLRDAGHRFVFQQLLALSQTEPGESMVDVHFENQEFSIPVHWRDAPPLQGICTFFYCREKAILDEFYSSFGQSALDISIWRAFQPAGCGWVHARKRANIKDRIKEKFVSAESAFQSMDQDGGGSLSRVELGNELRKLGIWLQPHELEHLMNILDEDNGGSIEKDEFVNFWNSC